MLSDAAGAIQILWLCSCRSAVQNIPCTAGRALQGLGDLVKGSPTFRPARSRVDSPRCYSNVVQNSVVWYKGHQHDLSARDGRSPGTFRAGTSGFIAKLELCSVGEHLRFAHAQGAHQIFVLDVWHLKRTFHQGKETGDSLNGSSSTRGLKTRARDLATPLGCWSLEKVSARSSQ